MAAAAVAALLMTGWCVNDMSTSWGADGKSADGGVSREYASAGQLHTFVMSAILSCHGVESFRSVGGSARELFEIDTIPLAKGDSDVLPAERVNVSLTALDRMAAALNFRLREERARAADLADRWSERTERLQIVVLLLGAVTTTLVGLNAALGANSGGAANSIEFRVSLLPWTSLGAIVVSALATAVSGYVAFSQPSTEMTLQRQRLAQLRNLHQGLVNVVQRHYGPPMCPVTDVKLQQLTSPDLAQPQQGASKPTPPPATGTTDFASSYWAAFRAVDKLEQDFRDTYPVGASGPNPSGQVPSNDGAKGAVGGGPSGARSDAPGRV